MLLTVEVTDHVDNLWVYIVCNDAALGSDVLEHFMKRLCLDLLAFELCTRVIEIKQDATLMQLLDKQLGPFIGRRFCRIVRDIQGALPVHVPMKGGRRSMSTFSDTTKRLLRCLRGGLPTMGMVSLGPARSLLSAVLRGGLSVNWVGVKPGTLLLGVDGALLSAPTTTIDGAGDPEAV